MRPAIFILLATFSGASIAHAQTCAGPLDLGALGGSYSAATAVSADGAVVVGTAELAGGSLRAFRWTASGGMQDLGTLGGNHSLAEGVSADGSVVVGGEGVTGGGPGIRRAFRWTAAGGMQDLGLLPGYAIAVGAGVSADGATAVGWARNFGSGPERAFRWTASGGMQGLGTLGGGAAATAASADGSVVVGWSSLTTGGQRAVRWTASGGIQDLGLGPDSRATDVSDDGSVVVGQVNGRAFRWSSATGTQDLGPGTAHGVSADGDVVVGSHEPMPMAPGSAFRWTDSEGLELLGVGFARGVGSGGSVVVGTLRFPPTGQTGAFRLQSSVLGQTYCRPAVANSGGCAGLLLASGSPLVSTGALELNASLLPNNATGYFLASRTQAVIANPGGSQGDLCLGGAIGRFVGPGQVMSSGAGGAFMLVVDLNRVPTPTGLVSVVPGETWNFQAWYRDTNPGPTSNFTDAVSVTFR